MKITRTLILSILILSCKQSENETVDLTENDQYILLNEYFIKDISDEGEYLVSLNQTEKLSNWILEPESYIIEPNGNVKFDFEIQKEVRSTPPKPWPGTSTTKWRKDLLEKFKILDEDTIENIFKINKHYNTNINSIHYLSPVLFNVRESLELIVDKPVSISSLECEPRAHYYISLKKDNKWQSLKKYGTDNVALIMERFKKKNRGKKQHCLYIKLETYVYIAKICNYRF